MQKGQIDGKIIILPIINGIGGQNLKTKTKPEKHV